MTITIPYLPEKATYPVLVALLAVFVTVCVMPLFQNKFNPKGKVSCSLWPVARAAQAWIFCRRDVDATFLQATPYPKFPRTSHYPPGHSLVHREPIAYSS